MMKRFPASSLCAPQRGSIVYTGRDSKGCCEKVIPDVAGLARMLRLHPTPPARPQLREPLPLPGRAPRPSPMQSNLSGLRANDDAAIADIQSGSLEEEYSGGHPRHHGGRLCLPKFSSWRHCLLRRRMQRCECQGFGGSSAGRRGTTPLALLEENKMCKVPRLETTLAVRWKRSVLRLHSGVLYHNHTAVCSSQVTIVCGCRWVWSTSSHATGTAARRQRQHSLSTFPTNPHPFPTATAQSVAIAAWPPSVFRVLRLRHYLSRHRCSTHRRRAPSSPLSSKPPTQASEGNCKRIG